ncbi:MAG: alpha/beta hydrolase, partial [Boseongicola sp. SB0673_bin_14]|nr:alpha/beta hydrolase [Boseongicola sp. SB0673_bin_14]
MESAPFRADLAEGPEVVRAVWRRGRDGRRVRVVLWPVNGAHGSILLFPGRTEYAEKYGRVARDLNGAGYAVATVDWRGQGFSDRLTDDARLGHVASFPDYQIDVAELVSTARADGLPEPWYLVAHSMGGCIGLRSLIEGLPVRKAIFSAPMWGLNLPFTVWPVAILLARLLGLLGAERRYIPGSGPGSHVT